MRLTLKNIGKIGEASVEIRGITVIAGENNTGKSTVSRALFAVFSSFFNIRKRFEEERIERIEDLIEDLIDDLYMEAESEPILYINPRFISETIVAHIDEYRKMSLPDMQKKICKLLSQFDEWKENFVDDNILAETIVRIDEVLRVSDNDFIKSLLKRHLNEEFNGQICNIFSEHDGKIELQIKENKINVWIKNEGEMSFNAPENLSLRTEAIYIDNPFVLDSLHNYNFTPQGRYRFRSVSSRVSNHQRHLLSKLSKTVDPNVFDEIITEDKFKDIYEKISSVCSGDIVQSEKSARNYQAEYRRKGSDKVLNVRNLSAGLKTFVILKMLLTSGVIERNGTIILDEPEIHLHPEWQLLFAELIVLIQKEFGVHVLLNTHSPYFLSALEVYSAKYEISDKCRFYLASLNGDISMIEDVTGHVEAIYKKLSAPFQNLENERGRL